MKIFITLPTSLLLLGLSTVLRAAEPSSVDDLKWLAGCWASVGAETGSGEQWTIPAGDTLFGVSRTVHGGKTANRAKPATCLDKVWQTPDRR